MARGQKEGLNFFLYKGAKTFLKNCPLVKWFHGIISASEKVVISTNPAMV
jgi:hypothetical protein